ncbi:MULTISPECIES: ScpA family protein [unclassified Actinobaculum]|uniref:segregation and condensation protein A n=1 Tax=unclassified Actinobaculum TaxID=2609299 RepID=UPI000D529955|nr:MULTISPECIES: ScpA family protein [unclassified Actinobaculum]AWE43472.1 segregation/condensation protein A [Actinobaculum sp. 313]RTE49514.1 segregation/condensation protein A [Actinobaculum sp. 352]
MDELFPIDSKGEQAFAVELDVFSGPFSVLLSLVARKRLDITEVALAEVTDEFIAFIRSQRDFDMSEASEFLVVAATLLDLKAARLLPRGEEEPEDLELLEQRDLLFAKLLQYRAYKEVAGDFAARMARESRSVPRRVPLEEQYARALPEVHVGIGVADLALLAAMAMSRSHKEPRLLLDHLHDPLVPVSTQISYLRERLVPGDPVSFASLCANAPNVPTVVARFMAVLELLRARDISVSQEEPLGPLLITAASDDGADGVGTETATVKEEKTKNREGYAGRAGR